MRAIDTNVVVRLLTADDLDQAEAARRAIKGEEIFLEITVLLEAEWVLRAGYGFEPAQIAQALRGLAGLPGMSVEEPAQLALALDWMEGGMDFADALHLVRSGHCHEFLTFDRKFVRRAAALAGKEVGNVRIVHLAPVSSVGKRCFGALKGKITVDERFDEPSPDEELGG